MKGILGKVKSYPCVGHTYAKDKAYFMKMLNTILIHMAKVFRVSSDSQNHSQIIYSFSFISNPLSKINWFPNSIPCPKKFNLKRYSEWYISAINDLGTGVSQANLCLWYYLAVINTQMLITITIKCTIFHLNPSLI